MSRISASATPSAGPRCAVSTASCARGASTVPHRIGGVLLTALFAGLAFALLAGAASAATYNTWTARTSGASTGTTLYGIAFPDAANGWIVGSGGVIRHTTNGGTTWTAQTSGTTQNLRDVAFVGASNGWVAGNGGVILHTTNGGTTWSAQTSGTTQTLRDIVFVDANNGWAVGSSGTIRHTTNGGTTWSAQTSGTTSALQSVLFRDASNGWVTGGNGAIRRTSNGGTTWSAQTSGTSTTLYGVAFPDANNGWVVGQTGTIRRTSNGGTTWSAQTSGTTQLLYSATFLDASYGWTVGAGGVILRTSNGGTAWSSQTSGITSVLRRVVSANGGLWACGASGRLLTYLIDITAPVTTATGLQADNHSGWRTTSQSVTLAAGDAQSGVSATYYTVDGGARQTYGSPFAVSGEGSHLVTYWSVDAGGNTEATHTGYVNIDATVPVTTVTGLQGDDNSGWRTTSQSVTLAAGDGSGSGAATTTYTVDGGAAQLYAGVPFVVAGNGSHAVTYFSTDVAGNSEPAHTGYVNIDAVAPLTTATGLQGDNHSGWLTSSQSVTLAAGDGAGSGVAVTRYTVDGGAAQTYTGSFTVSGQGSHPVTYFSQDAVGNTEATHTGYVNIDTTLPTVADDADANWHRSAATVHLSPADNGGSGVAGTQYRAQGSGAWLDAAGDTFVVPAPADGSGDGARVYQYRALDGAGNVSAAHSCTIWIDTAAPSTAASGLADDDLSGWTSASRTVELTPDDGAGSGVVATSYSVDGGPSQAYAGAFVVSGVGQHPVTYWSTDAAGNLEITKTGWVNISNPYAQAAGLAADDHSGWRTSSQTVTITAAGDHQPLSVLYRLAAGSWQTVASPAGFTVSGEGSHAVDFYARNSIGVESAHETGYVNIDLTAPSTTPTGLEANDHSGWTTTGQSVGFAAADGLSGPAVTFFRIAGGSWQIYSGTPFVVAGDGSHAVTYYSTDTAGNSEATHTGYVNIDAGAPATTAAGLQANDHSGWRNSGQAVSLNADDAGLSGVAATWYAVDGAAPQAYAAPFTIAAAGSHTVTYWSVDAAGNAEAHHAGYVNLDATAPSSTAAGLQSDSHSGWRTASQSVSLGAGDDLSGVAATSYTVDGGATQTYGAPFTVATQGSHAVVYWSVDAAGNAETQHTGYVNIDVSAPATTATGLQANDHTGWRTADQTVTLSAGDEGLSGVAATYYTVDSGGQQAYGSSFVVSGDGAHQVTYWSVDALGNTEGTHTGYVNIDASAPVTTATGLQADGSSGWRSSAQTVSLAADDAGLSGVAATYYRIDGGARQTYGAPFDVSAPGSHVVLYWSVDQVGTTETAHMGYVNIDTAIPTVGSDADGAWHNGVVTVHLSPADAGGSGLAGTQYRLQGSGTWLDAAGNAFSVAAPGDGSNDGVHAYEYRALDGAGSVSAIGACSVKIDTQGPVVTPTGLQPDSHSGWRQTGQSVSLAADDGGGAGVTAVFYTVDGGATQTYSGAFTVSGTGEHPVVYWATDALGNETSHRTGWVNISNPYAQAAGLANDNHSGWRNSSQTVTVTAEGDHQPLTIHYRVDSGAWQTVANPASVGVSGQGSHTVDYYASNTVGVESPHQTGYVNIDTANPATTATGLQANNHGGWTTTPPTVTLTPSDTLSGVSATRYTVDGGDAQTYTGPFTVSTPGSRTIAYWSVDAAGNTETSRTGFVNIDTAAPVTSAAGLQADPESGWITTTQVVTLAPVDGESGVAATYYTVDGGDQQTYAGAFTVTDDGSHEVAYWSVDALGNVEATATGYVNIDSLAATTTATGLQANGTSGWSTSAQAVTLSGDDHGGSGISALRYTVDGGATQTYAGEFTVSGQGSHPVVYWSVDVAGNTEGSHTGYVNIDATIPTVGSDADGAWHSSAVTVHLSPDDTGGSGLAAVQYRLQGAAWIDAAGSAFTVAAPADGSNDGVHAYEFRALDAAGNESATGASSVRIDTQKPSTSSSGLQADNHSGWRSSSQTVSLDAGDSDGSGVTATRYTVDGGPTQTYASAFTVSGQASHPVTYWSVDAAGNSEGTHTGYVNIDATIPTVGSDADGAWHNSAVTVHLSPADTGGSGLTGTQYRTQGSGAWLDASGDAFAVAAPGDGSNDGAHVYEYRALDAAGNESATGTCTVKIDTRAPLTTATGLEPDNHSGWRTSAQTVSLAADDLGGSGVTSITYTLDGGAHHTYSAPFAVSGSGRHRVTYWAVDGLGNLESPRTGYVNIDAVAPTTSAIGLAADDHSGWNITAQTVSLVGNDALSGVASTYYTIDGGGAQVYGGTFTVSADGSHPVTYWSVDNVGNTEATGSGYVNIDTAAPTTTATGLQADEHSGWRSTSQAVSLCAGDGTGSGVAATTYTLDGGAAQPYSGPFTVSGSGQHQVTYTSTDVAGNAETTRDGWVNISNPYAQAGGLANDALSGWNTGSATASVTASGDQGPFTIHYSTDGGGTWQTATSPLSITESAEGSHRIDYYSSNAVGVESIHQTGYLNIDATAPTTTGQGLQADNTAGWRNSPQAVTLSGDDHGGSGVETVGYTVDGGATQTYAGEFTVSGQGSHPVVYWSVDVAGNSESTHTGYVNIDASAPTVTSDADAAWHNSAVTVHLNPADAGGSGLAAVQYRLQGGAGWLDAAGNAFTVAAPPDGSNDGAHACEFRALDGAGNASLAGACTVRIDTQGPVAGDDGDTYWHNSAVTVHLTATDAGSGVHQFFYRLQGLSQWTMAPAGAASVVVPAPTDGLPHCCVYEYMATDNAGTAGAMRTFTVNMDTRMPNTALSGLPLTPWTNKPVSLTYTATPGDGAPIVRTEYSRDGGGAWTAWAAGTALTIGGPGETTILYRSVNATGRVENPPRTATVRIDVGRPRCLALKNVTAKAKKKAKLRYKITDVAPTCGTAKVLITIKQGRKIRKKITIAVAPVNVARTCSFKVKLKKGTYKWTVSAVDAAGNTQAKASTKKLIVK